MLSVVMPKSLAQLPSDSAHHCKPIQDVQLLRRLLEPVAQFACPLKGRQSRVGNRTMGGDQTRTQHKLEIEFELISRCACRQMADHLYPSPQMPNGFKIGGPGSRVFAGSQPIAHSAICQAAFGEMVGQDLGPRLDDLWETRLKCSTNLSM